MIIVIMCSIYIILIAIGFISNCIMYTCISIKLKHVSIAHLYSLIKHHQRISVSDHWLSWLVRGPIRYEQPNLPSCRSQQELRILSPPLFAAYGRCLWCSLSLLVLLTHVKMSAGVLLKSLHKVSRYSLAVLRAPLASSYHTERGVFGYRPRRGEPEEPDKELQALLNTHSCLNQGQCVAHSLLLYSLNTHNSSLRSA